ncbi:MAG TPA: siphovirus Gp157 family protein [Phycisphaerae bacterium]|nr:siphovirus Gp157 family protein [Phycisphaerae bacterium]
MKLYEIRDEIERAILDGIDPETGEVSDDLEQRLNALNIELREKAINVACYVKGLEAEAEATAAIGDAIRKQAAQHDARAKSLRNQADRLVAYLAHQLEGAGLQGTKITDPRAELRWHKSSRVEVVAGADVQPDCYLLPPKPREVSKKALADAMKLRHTSELRLADDDQTVLARVVEMHRLKIK